MNRVLVAIAFGSSLAGSFACPSPRSTTKVGDAGLDSAFDRKVDVASAADAAGADALVIDPGADAASDVDDTSCPANQHMCAGLCVDNSHPSTCGTSCTPCQAPSGGGTATCVNGECAGSCPQGMQVCMGACIDGNATCTAGCPTGRHQCGTLCPSSQDENACGTSCTPCPVPAGAAQATCDGTKCGFICLTGYHACGTRCARDNDATACGEACRSCPTDANGSAICNAGTCAIQCKTGFHLCGGVCVSDAAASSCGTSCTPCPVPAGGTPTCTQGACGGSCPTNQKLCLGSCIALTEPCSNVCPMGMHNCTGICVDNNSTNSCGTSCTACPVPAGASAATCDGTSCAFACRTGFHRCGATCAADSDATACGSACTACPTDANGTAICQAGACGLMCKTGFHLCGNHCVDNRLTANCGASSCTACPVPTGGMATCSGVACGTTCLNGQRICSGACIPTTQPCGGNCPTGTHDCSNTCSSDTSVASCGTRCSACPSPPLNGNATCDGTNCGIACASGFKNCPGTTTCVANSACCTACTGATPVCQNGTCVKRPLGQSCGSGTECQSGFCDQVCCSTACTGQCEACNSAGSCVAVTTPRTPCGGSGACAGRCDGNTRATCAFPTASTSCRNQSCSGGTRTSAGTCTGNGTCSTATITSCPSGTCNSGGTDCGACACTAGDRQTCDVCGLSQVCGATCAWGACGGTPSVGCCPNGLNDQWNMQLTKTSSPWYIFEGAPDTVDIDNRLVLGEGDRAARRTLPARGYVATITVQINDTANGTFAFDFGDTNTARLFPAVRMFQNQVNPILQVGGARPPTAGATTGTWGAFGGLSGTDGIPLSTRATMTVYVKSNAVAVKVVIAGSSTPYKSDFVTMNPRAFHMVYYATTAAAANGVATLQPFMGCQNLPDVAVQSRYETDPN